MADTDARPTIRGLDALDPVLDSCSAWEHRPIVVQAAFATDEVRELDDILLGAIFVRADTPVPISVLIYDYVDLRPGEAIPKQGEHGVCVFWPGRPAGDGVPAFESGGSEITNVRVAVPLLTDRDHGRVDP